MLNEHMLSQAIIIGALREAVSDTLRDPHFMHALAEEIADVLDGIEDQAFGRMLTQAHDGEYVSEDEVFAALKGE